MTPPRSPAAGGADGPAAADLELRARRALEGIPGVLAALLNLYEGSTEDAELVLAVAPGAAQEEVQRRIGPVLAELGLQVPPGAIRTAVLHGGPWAGGSAGGPATVAAEAPATAEEGLPRRALPGKATEAAPGSLAAGSRRVAVPSGIPARLDRERPLGGAATRRALLRRDVRVRREGGQVVCSIELARRGSSYDGEGSDLDTPSGRTRAAAWATLRAAEKAFTGARLALAGATFADAFARQHVILTVEAISGREHTSLTGIVVIDASLEEAACLATLRAVERWLSGREGEP